MGSLRTKTMSFKASSVPTGNDVTCVCLLRLEPAYCSNIQLHWAIVLPVARCAFLDASLLMSLALALSLSISYTRSLVQTHRALRLSAWLSVSLSLSISFFSPTPVLCFLSSRLLIFLTIFHVEAHNHKHSGTCMGISP